MVSPLAGLVAVGEPSHVHMGRRLAPTHLRHHLHVATDFAERLAEDAYATSQIASRFGRDPGAARLHSRAPRAGPAVFCIGRNATPSRPYGAESSALGALR